LRGSHYGADRTPPAGVGGGGPLARVLYMREKARGHSHNVCYGKCAIPTTARRLDVAPWRAEARAAGGV